MNIRPGQAGPARPLLPGLFFSVIFLNVILVNQSI
jgi:hypothetical protein